MGILSTHTDVWKCEIVKSNLRACCTQVSHFKHILFAKMKYINTFHEHSAKKFANVIFFS